ncbi:MAG: GNAT family N-acetyltransferase [Candidatus Hodarchaeota archaeon]
MLKIIEASSSKLIEQVRDLFTEYERDLGIDLEFQNFQEELESLPGGYAPPEGALLLAYFNGKLAGCVALRKLEEKICEMKRLYVRETYRARGIGKALSKRIIEEAKKAGYTHMRLDTLSHMKEAMSLYIELGFREIAPYRYNPFENAKFFELDLRKESENP